MTHLFILMLYLPRRWPFCHHIYKMRRNPRAIILPVKLSRPLPPSNSKISSLNPKEGKDVPVVRLDNVGKRNNVKKEKLKQQLDHEKLLVTFVNFAHYIMRERRLINATAVMLLSA